MERAIPSNIQLTPTTTVTTLPFFGKVRSINSFDRLDINFLLVGLLSILGCIGVTIYKLATLSPNDSDFVFAVLLCINLVFILHYMIMGVLLERWVNIGVYIITTLIVLLYCVVEYTVNVEKRKVEKLVRLILISIAWPISTVLAFLLIQKFSRSRAFLTDIVGGLDRKKNSVSWVYAFFSLLVLDLDMMISSVSLVTLHSPNQAIPAVDIALLVVSVVFDIVYVILGFYAVRRQSRALSLLLMISNVLAPSVIIYILIKIAHTWQTSSEDTYHLVGISAIIASTVAIIVRITLISVFIRVYLFFNTGLIEAVFNDPINEQPALFES